MIRIEFENPDVIARLQRALQQLQDTRPLMQLAAGSMHTAVEDNFEQQGRPGWAPLHPGTIAARQKAGHWPGKILQRSGRLRASIVQSYSDTEAVVGTNVLYAAIHQFGGKTKPHTIRPKSKKALAFGGVVRRLVRHPGSNIPARPFLQLTAEDEQHLVEDVEEFVAQILRQNGTLT